MAYLSRHDPVLFNHFTSCSEDLNDSNHSTTRVDTLVGSSKNHQPAKSVPNSSSSSCHENLPNLGKVVAQHQEGQQQNSTTTVQPPMMYHVRFSKVVQVREVPHRHDISPSEFHARWDMDPEISPSIFDAHLLDEELSQRSEEEEEKRRTRRRRAYLIRRQVLCEWFSSARIHEDDAAISLARKYHQCSAQGVQQAHVVALKLSHDVEEDFRRAAVPLFTTGTTDEALPPRKRISSTQPPLAAVKRLRLS